MCAFGFGGTNMAERIVSKTSRDSASEIVRGSGFEGHYEGFGGGYTVGFETFTEDVDMTPRLEGLREDRCQAPHWGYVVEGRLTYEFGDAKTESVPDIKKG